MLLPRPLEYPLTADEVAIEDEYCAVLADNSGRRIVTIHSNTEAERGVLVAELQRMAGRLNKAQEKMAPDGTDQ